MASSLESNKIAAAVLTAGVIAMLSGFAAELIYHPHEELAENAYVIEVPEGGAGGEVPVQEEPQLEPILPLLASADPSAGEQESRKCAACHTFEEGGANKVGPNLYDVVNRPIGGHEGYSYSNALGDMSGETWTYENLNAFLAEPRDFAPGTKMTFAGINSVGDRADMVAYLRSLSGSPAPLPDPAEAQPAEEAAPAEEGAPAEEAPAGEGEQPAEDGSEGQSQ